MSVNKHSKFYLSGSIDLSPDRGNGWRDKVTVDLINKFRAIILNPLHKLDPDLSEDDKYVDYRQQLYQENKKDELTHLMCLVRNSDINMVRESDFVLLKYEPNIPTCGTWREVFFALDNNIPVYIVCEEGVGKIPFWMWAEMSYKNFFSSFEEFYTFLETL